MKKRILSLALVDPGHRFRLIIQDVNCKKVEKPMPKLPVGTAFWTPEPNLYTGTEAMGIEAVYIDKDTTIRNFKNELMWNEAAYRFK